jgi:UDP-N-acetylmuramoylalanine--D-glutamate ligase
MHSQTAVCLNLSPDHLDWHIDLEDYYNCKRRIYTDCARPVFNRDDPAVYSTLDCADSGVSFGLNVPKDGQFGLASINGQEMLMFGDQQLMPAEQMRLRGRHQIANALAALALGQAAGLDFDAMIETLKTFQGLPHRTQYLGVHRGLHWVNDSKATNLGAALAALEGVGASTSGKIILLAGGQPKEPDYSALQAPLKQYGRAAIVFGQAAEILQTAIAEASPVVRVQTLKEAVDSAIGLAQEGDTILLAPACASFDQFKNYQARGDVFMQWVAD